MYVLSEALQSGKPHHKWKERARIGIYLGQSPIHNRNVALVLHRHTGHVRGGSKLASQHVFQDGDRKGEWEKGPATQTKENGKKKPAARGSRTLEWSWERAKQTLNNNNNERINDPM